ncbi:major facilitator superfamily domain-containing protein 6-like [Centruroides sculpturatus]|uniref:major facilitator superfamily domain-containing protein 6-like n=1 Tax=Centruroides sculpturatus TaxID=218467 RepID=UPI000C6DE260|nr:major facilitator superfamily domain-containing protein 6-like [Centruroides sculpturatus]
MEIIEIETNKKKQKCLINRRLLPLKIHYFLLAAAQSAVIPYLPIFAKESGISAIAVGVVQLLAPLIATVARPLFNAFTNYLHNLKQSLMGLVIINTICCIVVMFIPTSKTNSLTLVSTFSCDSYEWTTPLPEESPFRTLEANETIVCGTLCTTCAVYSPSSNITDILPDLILDNYYDNATTMICKQKEERRLMHLITLENGIVAVSNDSKPTCATKVIYNCTIVCPCNYSCCSTINDYANTQFWMILILYFFLSLLAAMMNNLSDTACYELVHNSPRIYGNQKLWTSLGTGGFALLTGYILDLFTSQQKTDYLVGFYIMVSVMFLDFVILCGVEVDVVSTATSNTEFLKLFSSCYRNIVFICFAFYIGIISTLLNTFLFWYLADLGASKTLMGMALFINCISEIPTYFYSFKIIEKLGHFITTFFALICYSIRYFMYSALEDPWYVLPVEVMQGLTYRLFYLTLSSYAKKISPLGTEITMKGILGAAFSGFGWAVGNILGGCLMDIFGGRYTFHYAAIATTIGYCLLMFLHLLLKFFENRRR